MSNSFSFLAKATDRKGDCGCLVLPFLAPTICWELPLCFPICGRETPSLSSHILVSSWLQTVTSAEWALKSRGEAAFGSSWRLWWFMILIRMCLGRHGAVPGSQSGRSVGETPIQPAFGCCVDSKRLRLRFALAFGSGRAIDSAFPGCFQVM